MRLEESAFDPWSDLGGLSHYYAIDQRYPKIGMRLNVWKADRFYSRKWFTTALSRNTDDLDPDSPTNRELFRHVDYLGFYPVGKSREGRFDLTLAHFYIKEQFAILKDYLADRKLPLRLLTPERIAACEKEQKGITPEELEELFNAAWEDFRAYAKNRIDAYAQQHVDRLLAVNPKLARASYGPMPIYTSVGRTAFVNCRPTLVERSDFLTRYQRGRATLSKRMADGLAAAFRFLAPDPAVKTERGDILAVRTVNGDIAVVLSDSSPLYGDTDAYPATFRFTVSAPGIGDLPIKADAPYSVVSKSRDSARCCG